MRISVQSYAGYRAEERPRSFTLDGHSYEVCEIVDRWFGPDHSYFKVRADDDNIYLMRFNPAQDLWTLEVFQQADRG
jgi:hypothetical protein